MFKPRPKHDTQFQIQSQQKQTCCSSNTGTCTQRTCDGTWRLQTWNQFL